MKFIREYESNRIEMEIPDYYTIDEVLDEFTSFLRACGYVIDYNKTIEMVNVEIDYNKPIEMVNVDE
jgi:hypothetical protein